MIRISSQELERLALMIAVMLVYLIKQGIIIKFKGIIILLTIALYFFPVKYISLKKNKQILLSSIIISSSLAIGIALLFVNLKILVFVFGILNIAYLIFWTFFKDNKELTYETYQFTKSFHFLTFLFLFQYLIY